MQNILAKLEATDRTHAVTIALQRGSFIFNVARTMVVSRSIDCAQACGGGVDPPRLNTLHCGIREPRSWDLWMRPPTRRRLPGGRHSGLNATAVRSSDHGTETEQTVKSDQRALDWRGAV